MVQHNEKRAAARMIESGAPPALHRLFRFESPVSAFTVASWQRELDAFTKPEPGKPRLIVRWEPGDVWQPIQRFLLWLAQDPNTVTTEPWIVADLRRGSPRSTGHYCGAGFCLCDMKANRWVGGASKFVDRATWQFYQETGLYGWRWWTIQGRSGGHRFAWDAEELASKLSVMRGGPVDTPAPGDLLYASFDRRVVHAIAKERRAADIMRGLENASMQKDALSREDRSEAERAMKALWDWTDERADALWNDGAELLPRYFEDQYGRAGSMDVARMDYEAVEQECLTATE